MHNKSDGDNDDDEPMMRCSDRHSLSTGWRSSLRSSFERRGEA